MIPYIVVKWKNNFSQFLSLLSDNFTTLIVVQRNSYFMYILFYKYEFHFNFRVFTFVSSRLFHTVQNRPPDCFTVCLTSKKA